MERAASWSGRVAGALGLLGLAVTGCGEFGGGDRAQVLRIREVVGTIEVAANADAEVVSTDTDKGLELLSKGGYLKIPEGGRVRVEFLQRKGIYHFVGPAEIEVAEAKLIKGDGGIHSRAKEVAITLDLIHGMIACAFEGSDEERPSIEIRTSRASALVEITDRVAVIVTPGKEWQEAWVRGERGPDMSLLLNRGGTVPFPVNGIVMFDFENPPGDESSDTATRHFSRGILEPLTLESPTIRPFDKLLYDISWKQVSRD